MRSTHPKKPRTGTRGFLLIQSRSNAGVLHGEGHTAGSLRSSPATVKHANRHNKRGHCAQGRQLVAGARAGTDRPSCWWHFAPAGRCSCTALRVEAGATFKTHTMALQAPCCGKLRGAHVIFARVMLPRVRGVFRIATWRKPARCAHFCHRKDARHAQHGHARACSQRGCRQSWSRYGASEQAVRAVHGPSQKSTQVKQLQGRTHGGLAASDGVCGQHRERGRAGQGRSVQCSAERDRHVGLLALP